MATTVPCSQLNFASDGPLTKGTVRVEPFQFECGVTLPYVDIYFEAWGKLNAKRTNAVLVCHALTGDARAGGDGWWNELIGPGAALDTDDMFFVCANVLGGCGGSTGPSTLAEDGAPYGLRFPLLTIRDMVASQRHLMDALDIPTWQVVIGGSLGGMQVWEWAVAEPERVRHAIPIAAHAAFPPLAIGYNEAMRQAIVLDPDWNGGAYYHTGRTPKAGLSAARAIGMLTYRTGELFHHRFERRQTNVRVTSAHDAFTSALFDVESYLRHHGEKLNQRFDANSYLYLTRAMDGHDIGRGRGGLERALDRIRARLSIIGIQGDYLYNPVELQSLAAEARLHGVNSACEVLDSIFGHDAFLAEQTALSNILRRIGLGADKRA